jgi:REP element-mobilizing transposase RayT
MDMEPARHGYGRRRSIRLKGADYSRAGIYFVTICADRRRCVFGLVENGAFSPKLLGCLIRECWLAIPAHFSRVELNQFVVMPNHLHGVLVFHDIVGAQHRCAHQDGMHNRAVAPKSLAAVIRSFKAIVARRAHEELKWRGEVWQRNYFERIIRGGRELADASRYIGENVTRWERDEENPSAKF